MHENNIYRAPIMCQAIYCHYMGIKDNPYAKSHLFNMISQRVKSLKHVYLLT